MSDNRKRAPTMTRTAFGCRQRARAGAGRMATFVAIVLVSAGAVATPAPVLGAEAGKTIQYGRSTAPFWQVGAPDANLTKLCRRGLFNQRAHETFYIGYHGLENPGRGYTGIAKQNYNLVDPTGQAEPEVTYHFFNDGYSNCKVYTAPDQVQEEVERP